MGVQINGSTGAVTGTQSDWSGNVSIGGTLTYEDVTNIDAVGLITARTGIEFGARPGVAASISSDGNMIMSGISTFGANVTVGSGITLSKDGDGFFTGIVTATSYYGSGANLTGIDATQIVTGNTSVQTVDTGSDGHIKLTTEGTERARITSAGKVGINQSAPDGLLHIFSASAGSVSADADADELVLESSGNTGMSILSPGTGESSIYFGNPGTNGEKDGWIKYYHETHSTTANRRNLVFTTATNERLRIDSSGRVKIGGAAVSQNRDLVVASNAEANLAIETHNDATSETANIRFYKSGNTGASPQVVETNDNIAQLQAYGYDGTDYACSAGAIKFSVDGAPGSNDMPGKITFSTTADGASSPTERLRIDASGRTGINDTSPTEATLSVVQHSFSVCSAGLNIHTNGEGGGSGSQYALKITGTSANNCPMYGIHIDKTQQYTQPVTGIYCKVGGTYDNPISGHFIVNGTIMNTGGYVVGVKGEVMSDSGSNNNRVSRALWGYNGAQQGSDTYAIQADTVTGGNGDLRGYQYLHGGSTKFYVNSSGNVWSSSNSYSSDRDIKTDIQTLTGTSLNLIKQLVPKTFKWRESKENEKDGTIYKPDGATLTGFIAQEVQAVIPSIVTGTDGSKEMGINYNGLVAHLVNTVKELSTEIDTLKAKVDALE